MTNIYDVSHVNGDIYEVEADFYQRDGEDWTFFADGSEVFRVAWSEVLSVSKSPIRPRPVVEPSEQVWL